MRWLGVLSILFGLGAFALPSFSRDGDAQARAPGIAQADLVPDAANRGVPFVAGSVLLLGGIAMIVATRTKPVAAK